MAEVLPDEIYLLIFRYLHKFHRILAFSNLNQRFQRLIVPYLYEIKFIHDNTDTLSYMLFDLFCKKIFPFYAQHIRSLTLTNNQQYELLQSNLHRCTNLKSLTIGSVFMPSQDSLKSMLVSLPSLTNLEIQSSCENMLHTVSCYASSNLTTICLSHPYGSDTLPTIVLRMRFITCLFITLPSARNLMLILKVMCALKELNLSLISLEGSEKLSDESETALILQTLHIEMDGSHYSTRQAKNEIKLQQLKTFLNLFKNCICSLTLILMNVTDEYFSDFDQFRSLTATDNHFTHLKNFEYYINTIHQPKSCHFPNVGQIHDGSYVFHTQPKPMPFDNFSKKAFPTCRIHQGISLPKLLNPVMLYFDSCCVIPPISFDENDDLAFIRLQTIVCDDPIDDLSIEMRKFLKNVINRSPNLKNFALRIEWAHTKNVIERVFDVFGENNGKRIKYFEMPICTVDNETSYSFPELFSKISMLFSNLKRLDVYVELTDLNNGYKSMILFIEEIKNKFQQLVYLRLKMHQRDEIDRQIFLKCKEELDACSDSLYYSAENIHDMYYYLDIWL